MEGGREGGGRERAMRTEAVNDTIPLFFKTRKTAYPFTAVAEGADPFDFVWTVECWREEVPYLWTHGRN